VQAAAVLVFQYLGQEVLQSSVFLGWLVHSFLGLINIIVSVRNKWQVWEFDEGWRVTTLYTGNIEIML